MRSFLLVIAVAGCGRLGFDDVAGGGDGPLGDAAAAVPNICNPRSVEAFSIGSEIPTKVRATQLSDGFAVAVETDAANVYMARLDVNGAFVSMHLPFGGGYALYGISQIEDRPFVYVFTSGAGFIKMLVPDWSSYDTGPSGVELPMDPQQALLPGGALAMYGVISGGTLNISAIDTSGTTTVAADYAPQAASASFTPTPSGARVVVENAGTCETFAIKPDGTTKDRHGFSPCHAPLLAMLDDVSGAVLYQTAQDGPLAIHFIPAIATDPGTTMPLEIGTNARITVVDGSVWVAYLRGSGEAKLVRFDEAGTTTRDFITIVDAFELLPSSAFWFESGSLRTGDTCL